MICGKLHSVDNSNSGNMNSTVQTIPFLNLALVFVPALVAVGILFKWSLGGGNAIYAIARMLVQLLLIGYLLTFISNQTAP